MSAVLLAAACSSPHHDVAAPSASPTTTGTTPTTVITADTWVAPTVVGPPSAQNFCTLLVAAYEHEAALPQAKNLSIRQKMVADFVGIAPRIVAEAPTPIASAATTYFQTVSGVLSTLNAHGLNVANLKPGQSSSSLLSPQMQSATEAVNTYATENCHYTIGG